MRILGFCLHYQREEENEKCIETEKWNQPLLLSWVLNVTPLGLCRHHPKVSVHLQEESMAEVKNQAPGWASRNDTQNHAVDLGLMGAAAPTMVGKSLPLKWESASAGSRTVMLRPWSAPATWVHCALFSPCGVNSLVSITQHQVGGGAEGHPGPNLSKSMGWVVFRFQPL